MLRCALLSCLFLLVASNAAAATPGYYQQTGSGAKPRVFIHVNKQGAMDYFNYHLSYRGCELAGPKTIRPRPIRHGRVTIGKSDRFLQLQFAHHHAVGSFHLWSDRFPQVDCFNQYFKLRLVRTHG